MEQFFTKFKLPPSKESPLFHQILLGSMFMKDDVLYMRVQNLTENTGRAVRVGSRIWKVVAFSMNMPVTPVKEVSIKVTL